MATPLPKQRKGHSHSIQHNQHHVLHSHPLAVPEIIKVVGEFLSEGQRITCLRVNKVWHQTLIQGLWNDINASVWHRVPPLSSLTSHAHLVREFYCEIEHVLLDPHRKDPLTLPNLELLDVMQEQNNAKITNNCLAAFILRHKATLKTFVSDHCNSAKVLDALSKCKKLETIDIKNFVLESPDIFINKHDSLWTHPQLKDVTLGGPWFYAGRSKSFDVNKMMTTLQEKMTKPTSLQYLTIKTPKGDQTLCELQAFFIKKCPELVTLSWTVGSLVKKNQGAITHLAKAIASGIQFPKLERIHLPEGKDFKNQELKTILQGMTALTKVALPKTNFDITCWNFMKNDIPRYMSTLKELDVRGCAMITGAMVQDALCSVATLEVLKANYVKSSNFFEDPRPWACTGLKKLALGFILNLGDEVARVQEARHMAFERISKLTKLEELSIDTDNAQGHYISLNTDWDAISYHESRKHSLELMLTKGLDRLKTLR
ncbi:hypothetical protein BGZ83_005903, partial [Gryganskiella cystojenkinii]